MSALRNDTVDVGYEDRLAPENGTSCLEESPSNDSYPAKGRGFDRLPLLMTTIDKHVIPRLVSSHRTGPSATALLAAAQAQADLVATVPAPRQPVDHEVVAEASTTFDDATVTAFANALLSARADIAEGFLDGLRRAGNADERLCLELLAPAAQHLGMLWEDDRCHFVDVTLALGRLQSMLNDLCSDSSNPLQTGGSPRRVLLLSLANDQHTFGVKMVGQFFQKHGWDVWTATNGPGIVDMVQRDWFAVIGVALNSELRIDDARCLISRLRGASCNRSVGFLIGGPIVYRNPEIGLSVGADLVAQDAGHAVKQAEALLTSQKSEN